MSMNILLIIMKKKNFKLTKKALCSIMEHHQRYINYIKNYHPNIYDELMDTNMTICHSALTILTKKIEQVDTNYIQNKYFITYFEEDIRLIHDSLRTVDTYIDEFNKRGFIFKNMCSLQEKKRLQELFDTIVSEF